VLCAAPSRLRGRDSCARLCVPAVLQTKVGVLRLAHNVEVCGLPRAMLSSRRRERLIARTMPFGP
jgi:hypothetical protein